MLEAGSALELAVPAEEVMAFDAEWAAELLNQALALVESAFVEQGKSQRFAVLRSFLPGGGEAPSQSSAAEMLGISENTLRIDLTRLRGKLREALRAEIARTVSAPHEIDTEMSHLIAVLLHQPAV
jgi:DNA-directed RNA polymerase specialized sigma24 family protein